MGFDGSGKIWMNGDLVDWDQAQIHVLTHTLHYGVGAFEGIRSYRRTDGSSVIFRLEVLTVRDATDEEIEVGGSDGVHMSALVVDESFRGMNRVQQQRAVYAAGEGDQHPLHIAQQCFGMVPSAIQNHQLLWPLTRLQASQLSPGRSGPQERSPGIKRQPGSREFFVAANQ